MTPATKARLATYITGFVGFAGLALAGAGLSEFDAATGMIDFAPFNAYALAAAVPGAVATVLAPLAVVKKWGSK